MSEEKSQTVFCPSCRQPATKIGNEITCEQCDAVFEIKQKGEAKIKRLGPLEDHEERLKKIEDHIFPREPEPLSPDPEPEPEKSDDILPR